MPSSGTISHGKPLDKQDSRSPRKRGEGEGRAAPCTLLQEGGLAATRNHPTMQLQPESRYGFSKKAGTASQNKSREQSQDESDNDVASGHSRARRNVLRRRRNGG